MIHSTFKQLLLLTTVIVSFSGVCMSSHADTQLNNASVQQELNTLEASSGGQLGISAIDTANNARIEYHAEKHFPFKSTFKIMGVSAILKRSTTDSHLLQQKITYKKSDLVFWSPISEKYFTDGMTISELCAAAIMYSDNTAINLLVKKLGGPKAVTVFARSIGDNAFRLDGWEPELNSNPHDLRDSSTPAAMEKSLQQLTLGNALPSPQREQLITWMKDNTTGNNRIRAGVPKGWIVADKTGSGDYGITNDIGVIWPPKCAPIIVTIFYTNNKKDAPMREDVVASATRILINDLEKSETTVF